MKKHFKKLVSLSLVLLFGMTLMVAGCNKKSTETKEAAPSEGAAATTTETSTEKTKEPEKKQFVIGMSQCNLGEPWRVAMNDQIQMAAEKHPEFKVIFADAAQDNSKQIADIQNFIQQKVDLLIASPNEATPLTNVIKEAYEGLCE